MKYLGKCGFVVLTASCLLGLLVNLNTPQERAHLARKVKLYWTVQSQQQARPVFHASGRRAIVLSQGYCLDSDSDPIGSPTVKQAPVTQGINYVFSPQGVMVNLEQGIGYIPDYPMPLKVMPLGDSITQGHDGVTELAEQGGYRPRLWQHLKTLGLDIDFVGSQISGPSGLEDKDHEGHAGWEIMDGHHGSLIDEIDLWLDAFQPDVVLLMVGTNDTWKNTPSQAIANNLNQLIQKMTDHPRFEGEVLVASIPPKDPARQVFHRVQRALELNAQIPQLVEAHVNTGKRVTFVDIAAHLSTDDLAAPPDQGLHPNAQGYAKIADAWYTAILESTGVVNHLISVQEVIGSAFNDVLAGNSAANTLTGGPGDDLLTGGSNANTFFYRGPNEGTDTITDFEPENGDTLLLYAPGFDKALQGDRALGSEPSEPGIFVRGVPPVPLSYQAHFLYNTETGLFSFDADGRGPNPAIDLAILQGAPSLTAEHIELTTNNSSSYQAVLVEALQNQQTCKKDPALPLLVKDGQTQKEALSSRKPRAKLSL